MTEAPKAVEPTILPATPDDKRVRVMDSIAFFEVDLDQWLPFEKLRGYDRIDAANYCRAWWLDYAERFASTKTRLKDEDRTRVVRAWTTADAWRSWGKLCG